MSYLKSLMAILWLSYCQFVSSFERAAFVLSDPIHSPQQLGPFLLTVFAVLHEMQYNIDIYTKDNCKSLECLGLAHVSSNPAVIVNRINVISFRESVSQKKITEPKISGYKLYACIGYDRYPRYFASGTVFNMYIWTPSSNQVNKQNEIEDEVTFPTYDAIFLNNRHSLRMYSRSIQQSFRRLQQKNEVIPTVYLVPIPIQSLTVLINVDETSKTNSNEAQDTTIVLFHRIGNTRHPKGHIHLPIKLFKDISQNTLGLVNLVIIMASSVDQTTIDALQQEATATQLPIQIRPFSDTMPAFASVSQTCIFWHFPAHNSPPPLIGSESHLIEAMAHGCIPIALHNSDAGDYFTHQKSGFLTHSYTEFVDATMTVLKMPPARMNNMKIRVIDAVAKYSPSNVHQTLFTLIRRGELSQTFNTIVRISLKQIRSKSLTIAKPDSKSNNLTALIVEPSINLYFEVEFSLSRAFFLLFF